MHFNNRIGMKLAVGKAVGMKKRNLKEWVLDTSPLWIGLLCGLMTALVWRL